MNEDNANSLLPIEPFASFLGPASVAVAEHVSLERLRYLLAYPVWGIAQQFAVRTRSYEQWLTFIRVLLRAAFIYQPQLTDEEQRSFFPSLFHSYLAMLDKLDRWKEYLSCWHVLRECTRFSNMYSADAISQHGGRIEPFVLSHHGSVCHVHFLYDDHRRRLIERKLAKQQAGRPLGNMEHAPQSELSSEDIRQRIVWLVEFLRHRQRTAAAWREFWSTH